MFIKQAQMTLGCEKVSQGSGRIQRDTLPHLKTSNLLWNKLQLFNGLVD